jgi:hypothetical protein
MRPVIWRRLSITSGNILQIAGILVACVALHAARSARSAPISILSMLLAWILLYLFCHALAHWLVGRMLGIRFLFYTVGGTANPEGWPPGVRWAFTHLPFLGVQTDQLSMQKASPRSRALMWSAGVTSSAIVPLLSAVYARLSGLPGSGPFCFLAVCWALGTLASNWRSRTGDYAKARRALGRS